MTLKSISLYIAWFQSMAAVLLSLYYSEVKHFAPCILCWYQRIFMYPLVLIILVGILRKDKKIQYYVLPLAILGWLVAIYQVLLQTGIIPESISPCTVGISCLTKYTEYFGFISIPVLSLAAFSVIIACMLVYQRLQNNSKS